jgi:5'-3' exonuclease
VILIDADILAYRIGWSCNLEDESTAVRTLDGFIIDLLTIHLGADEEDSEYVLYLTGKGNFRKEYAVTAGYKANRKDKEKPVHVQALRDHMIAKWAAVVTEGEEADDAIAIAATKYGDKAIMVSLDKDFDQIEGWHYNFVKRSKYYVTKEEGLNFFYRQILMGDRIDNIIGIYGIGREEVSEAARGLQDREGLLRQVCRVTRSEERVLENGSCCGCGATKAKYGSLKMLIE